MKAKYENHGLSSTPEHRTWLGIKGRCNNPNNPDYVLYGGRGIKVCKEWNESFLVFLQYLKDHNMYPRPEGASIDRIDVNKDYEPGNIKWSTDKEQANNTRYNRKATIDGITKTWIEWEQIYGVSPTQVSVRIRQGWTLDEAITTPLKNRSKEIVPVVIKVKKNKGKKKDTVNITIGSETHNLAEWARIKGVRGSLFYNRYQKGWRGESIILTPKLKKRSDIT